MPRPLNAREEKACLCLAMGRSQAHTARVSGMSLSTVKSRLKRPEFAARVVELRAEILGRVCDRLAAMAGKAVSTLHLLMDDPRSEIRLGSSRAILEHMIRCRDHFVFEQRLSRLEAISNGQYEQPEPLEGPGTGDDAAGP